MMNRGYFRNLLWAVVAVILFPKEIFLCTFYAVLPCFAKHDGLVGAKFLL